MPYAFVTKHIVKKKNVNKSNKLQRKLDRELLEDEVIYKTRTFLKYLSVISPYMSDYAIMETAVKDEAVFYLENELPIVKHRLKNMEYSIIDVDTKEEVERLPASINAILMPETIGELSWIKM